MSEVAGTPRSVADVPPSRGGAERGVEEPTSADPVGSARAGPRRALLRLVPVAGAVAVAAACSPGGPRRPTTVPPTTRPTTTVPPTTTTTVPTTTSSTTSSTTTTTTLPPPPPPPEGWADPFGLHVARRLTWGATPGLADDIATRGLPAWLDDQLDWQAIDDSHLGPILAPWPRPGWDAPQIHDDEEWRVPTEMAAHETLRRVYSNRQLHEVLVDFVHDHFNIDVNHPGARPHFPSFYRDVIKVHALGSFSDLLVGVGTHPAMLLYLDQATSRADGGRTPNENYARELMELHTVGTDGGYDQSDVVAVAHLLTGWTVTSATGGFTFRSEWHDPGPMTPERVVLGWSRGELTGEAAGRSFLAHLARLPVTARRLCHKLAVRLIGEQVTRDSAVVSSAADAYLAADTSIAAAVRSLVLSPEFASSVGARIRRPHSLATQMARALQRPWVQPSNPESFMWANWSKLDQLGHAPHTWPTPDGYPDENAHWLSAGALVSRWNLAVWLACGSVDGMPFTAADTMGWAPNHQWGEWLDALARAFVGEPWPPEVRASVLAQHEVTETTVFRSWDHWSAAPVVTVLLQTPVFQRH